MVEHDKYWRRVTNSKGNQPMFECVQGTSLSIDDRKFKVTISIANLKLLSINVNYGHYKHECQLGIDAV